MRHVHMPFTNSFNNSVPLHPCLGHRTPSVHPPHLQPDLQRNFDGAPLHAATTRALLGGKEHLQGIRRSAHIFRSSTLDDAP